MHMTINAAKDAYIAGLERCAEWHEHIAAQFRYDAQGYTETDARWALNRASEHENYAAQFRRWIEDEKK